MIQIPMAWLAPFFILYCVALVALGRAWRRLWKNQTTPQPPPVTVVVPFRNEAAHLPQLLADLQSQLAVPARVIWVDDHSEDEGPDWLRKQGAQVEALTTAQGKKAALEHGVARASTEWIATIDADVRLSPGWWTSLAAPTYDRPQFILGPVAVENPSAHFFGALQQVEWASVMLVTGATAFWGRPIMANGANLAFRKSAFERVGGYEGNRHIASGDDEFLLRKVAVAFPDSVAAAFSPGALVRTEAHARLSTFWSQRLRWAGKWRHNSDWRARATAVVVWCFQGVQVVSLLLLPLYPMAGVLWFIKMVTEAWALYRVSSDLKMRWSWGAWLALQLVYPLYVLAVGAAAGWSRPWWKGRQTNVG